MPSNNNKKDYFHSNIIGIQFSVLSPDEIRKGSVVEITNRDTYVNNKPVIGGLFDPRMGVLEPGLICPTDGHDYMNTPGYFGHIELARPVYYIQYLNIVMKILRCVCYKCSKLLINRNKYKYLLDLPGEARWNQVFSLASKINMCGDGHTYGCGCKQPKKIKKEGLANVFAEWDNSDAWIEDGEKQITLKITPEYALQIFRRISNEDADLMGFNPLWSRPDWMICQVLLVPPPAVRPSVKHDSQQRSEDDITHILVNIIKTNKMLKDRIEQGASENIIEDWTLMLQYYIATQVDNQIPGVGSVTQRSGRPLKSIKERLNGKSGRVRGNLMGKRVDYSARSVITGDPNLSIRELGVPLKVAKNITKPIVVNANNIEFLTKLVQNGPDNWPGAKILEKKNKENISLRYVKLETIHLEYGDVVHRHMMDGDAILFNRQPTLHRMSMMCHIVKVMKVGETFRMNVADTKPYNADFDGDEMNLFMPQDPESESELLNLAHVPYQIISPAQNSTIIGIFQDSLLGTYRFTRDDINFSERETMNLLMNCKNINLDLLKKDNITSFDILSQILPPISLKYSTKHFKEDNEDYNKSNNVLEIVNGNIKRGQLEKSTLGSTTMGILHRICNDYGNMAASKFIDDLQGIVTDYMKTSSFSVGVSDLISNEETTVQIENIIINKQKEINDLINQTHLNVFENDTGKTNIEEFETQVEGILNHVTSQAGKIGRDSLDRNNRFVTMMKAGSKGSEINISQMTCCLGQQTVNGKRIPYGFENRTLPHFHKYDDTPRARGFVENSYIKGLTPDELFFHAMGGRTGLIDTAVKTSQTGYIQRRLIKGMEDLKVEYDMTVRNSKGKIVQFSYGDDGIDTIKIESQKIQFIEHSNEEIYAHYYCPSNQRMVFDDSAKKRLSKQSKKLNEIITGHIDNTINMRGELINYVYSNRSSSDIHMPVAFKNIINNIHKQSLITSSSLTDITPYEAYEMINEKYSELEQYCYYCKPTRLFKMLYYYYLCPRELILIKRFNKDVLHTLLCIINEQFKRSIVAPGEMVGMIAAQSIGEPTTQMTLNTFHFAGVASKSNVTRGVPRIEEILSLSENLKKPSLTIYLPSEYESDKMRALSSMYMIEHANLNDVVQSVEICFDPNDGNTKIHDDIKMLKYHYEFEKMIDDCNNESSNDSKDNSKWVLRLILNPDIMLQKNITMDDINYSIKSLYNDDVDCIFSDYNSENLTFRIRLNNLIKKEKLKKDKNKPLDQSDEIYIIKNFQDNLLKNVVLRGIKNISKVRVRKIQDNMVKENDKYEKQEAWVLDTDGSNLIDVLSLDYIDTNRTHTNSIPEIYNVLGIEAARQSIFNELAEVIEDVTYINYHHTSLLCDRMTYNVKLTSIFRHGLNNDNTGAIAKASFEETPEMFLKAARHGELDLMTGVSANVMCGQQGYYGTSAFKVVLDIDMLEQITDTEIYNDVEEEIINALDKHTTNDKVDDPCSTNNIKILSSNIVKPKHNHTDDTYMPDF